MTHPTRRAWLIAGAMIGCALAAIQILHDVRVPILFLPSVAARVNGREIDRTAVDRTVAGFDDRLRRPDSSVRDRVLTRMIDEELLVQHALDSGAAETDPEVRAALARAAISRLNSEVSAESMSVDEIEAFYATHRPAYAGAATYEVTPLYYDSPDFPNLLDARRRADTAVANMHAGQAIEAQRRLADPLPLVPPGSMATARTLANYFGASIVAALDRIRPGETTPPDPFGHGVLILYLNKRVEGMSPPLSSIRELVQADALRDKQENALEHLLQSLRKAAQIDMAPLQNAASQRLLGLPTGSPHE
ncbi:MAG: peptidyl-prolyl cis-trans isomerase [Gammaproteobacteria bacterium]|nr:peptidyl-prolyl cis-trans isomerase [Gammaproteobacteria bacterium]